MPKSTWRLVGALTLLATLIVAMPAATSAEEFDCTGAVGAVTLDNVCVPDGETCVLDGTKVEGTIKVETGATLRADRVRVIGNVQGENAAKVAVRDSKIGGSYQACRAAGEDRRHQGQGQHPHRRERPGEQGHRQHRHPGRAGLPEHRRRRDPR